MQKTVDPSGHDFKRLAAEVPQDVPIVMLNLLKFRAVAAYPPEPGRAEVSGRAAYATYSREVAPILQRRGGRPIWHAEVRSAFIAPEGEDWDEVLLVSYPSVQAFLAMVTSAEYQAVTIHRRAALENARLIATLPDQPKG
ncbi:DUF1330 domain-containing protein [Deinococcus irradiatisoli]|uniref:DUF1330 domain-containing protein n=1 Tax=Deinococcus irradiatisoli TaxID=2202254 RepID=A0A2Z3JE58_9DEIO|nr:DUF1330 domain-containing protein [Deinococcus irradiatisoli]AWN23457.1 DUF1330 domain-containing protein [Deinococcus irradiatisoli]